MKIRSAICMFVTCLSLSAQAELKNQFTVSVTREAKVLKIQLVETESRGTMCDLIVTRFEYLADLKMLNVETVESEFCPTDIVGARKAYVLWQLPQRLRKEGSLNLRVNGKVLSNVTWSENQ